MLVLSSMLLTRTEQVTYTLEPRPAHIDDYDAILDHFYRANHFEDVSESNISIDYEENTISVELRIEDEELLMEDTEEDSSESPDDSSEQLGSVCLVPNCSFSGGSSLMCSSHTREYGTVRQEFITHRKEQIRLQTLKDKAKRERLEEGFSVPEIEISYVTHDGMDTSVVLRRIRVEVINDD